MPDGRSACTHACMTVSRQAVTSSGFHACKPADRMERFPSCRRACMHAVRTASQPASMTACQPARFHGERCPKHRLGEMSVQQIAFSEILMWIQSDESVSRSTVLNLPYTAVVVGSSPAAGTRHDGRRARQVQPIHLPVWSRVRGFLTWSSRAWDVTGDAPPGADRAVGLAARYCRMQPGQVFWPLRTQLSL